MFMAQHDMRFSHIDQDLHIKVRGEKEYPPQSAKEAARFIARRTS
jgi:hypothetical protein